MPTLNGSDQNSQSLSRLRFFVAITPVAGALIFPLVVPLVMTWLGISSGVLIALALSTVWFVAMLSTSEMPH